MIFKKKWEECWFLANPQEFIYTHLPLTSSNEVEVETQLVPKPYESLEEWAKQVLIINHSPVKVTFFAVKLTQCML